MPLIRRRRVSLALEHMSKMAPAIAAHDFRARHAQRAIHVPRDGARNGVEEGGPAAAGLEFVRGLVEGRGAAGTGVYPVRWHVFVVNAFKGRFGTFVAENAELFYTRGR